MAKKKVKKAAPKQAKKAVRRPVKRAKPARPARQAKSRAMTKKAAAKVRKSARPARKATRTAKPKATKLVKRPAQKAAAKPVKKAAPAAVKPKPVAKPKAAPPAKRMPVVPPPTLQRERRRLPEAEEETFTNVSDDSRLMSSARSGHDELRSELKQHTEASPVMTAGDVDAKWQDAYALGDEAPGGDNMTPDQDRVDDIGKALGIEYADDEELLGGDEIVERDEHRWELDPASKEDDDDL